MQEYICKACGQVFRSKRKVDYCSVTCWSGDGNKGKQRSCYVCGKEFDCGKNRRKTTCSRTCSCELSWLYGRKPQERTIPKTCDNCGKPFMARTNKQRFCNIQCTNAWHERLRKVDHRPRKCVWCGKEFQPKTVHDYLCSEQCREDRDAAGLYAVRSVKILITEDIPVFAELRPERGIIYDAEYMVPNGNSASEAYLIRNIHGSGKHVFVRRGECLLVEADEAC